jgi:ribonuclease J
VTFAQLTNWKSRPKYRIGILGGIGEFGRNCTVIEDPSGKLLVIDVGIMFPGPGLPGVNRIIPDFENLAGREADVVGLVITHGHEDHIGAISQFLDRVVKCDIFASPLASGIFERKLRHEHRQGVRLVDVKDAQELEIGPFRLTFIAANHSIPQTLGVMVEIQGDLLYFTGDFRLDDSPLLGHQTNHLRVSEFAKQRAIRYMFVDATNAGQEGSTRRESSVMTSIRPAVAKAQGRIYFTTFASHIERQFLAITLAQEYGRKVYVAGAAMTRNVRLAAKLGLHTFPEGLFVDRVTAQRLPPSQLLVLASGSQGEEGSFLDRLAHSTQAHFELRDDDLIIFSSVPIPGNEPKITRNIDAYLRAGAEVLHYRDHHVHVSGHARNDEIGSLINTANPTCVVPVHGDHYNILRCAELAKRVGPYDTLILSTGDVLEVFEDSHSVVSQALSSRPVYVDDQNDDIPDQIVRDRRILSEQGLIIIQLFEADDDGSYELGEVTYVGFSGKPVDALIEKKLDEINRSGGGPGAVRQVRELIYRHIGGPRGRQAKVVVSLVAVESNATD